MKNKTATSRKSIVLLLMVFVHLVLSAQSLKHPHIWAYAEDREAILDNISKYDWAESLFDQLKARVDSDVATHKTNPATTLNAIPNIPGLLADRTPHTEMLASASEAAILYYLTEDTDYAQYAADILSHYNQYLSVADSGRYRGESVGIIFETWWLESRALYPKIAVTYDFLYDYVNDANNDIYQLSSNSRIPFDNDMAQTTVKTLAAIVLKSINAPNSNHSVLASNGALYNLMMIDDDGLRETYFKRYYEEPNDERFDAYQWTLNVFTEEDVWDETFGYSKGSHEYIIQSLNVIDRYKPELDIVNKNLRILDGFAFYENYYYPSGANLRFGDTGYENDLLKGYQWILKMATRKNMPTYATMAKQALRYEYNEMGVYQPTIITDRLGWFSPLQLLWGVNVDDTVTPQTPELHTTQQVTHAGIVIQRNYSTPDVENDGLMYYSGGATYVHAHSSGIDLELYGKGFVMGAESGSSSYGTAEHEDYRVRHASHNTVIANGSGKRIKNWSSRMSNVELVACEPLSEQEALSSKFSFATQYINDTFNDCVQQRTNGIIRTSATTGYYLDFFRSKGKTTNNYHDYIYHNIGDGVSLNYADNSAVAMSSSTKYSNDISSESVTGWKFFESVKSSVATDKAVNATFNLAVKNKKMYMYTPAGIAHEYATALAPYTKGASQGYGNYKTPTMTMRKMGEAWDAPFVAIFEPTDGSNNSVQSVVNMTKDGKVVGAIVTSEVGGAVVEDYILSFDKEETIALPEHYITFTGRFAVVRKVKQTETTQTVTIYIGQGTALTYGDLTLTAGDDKKAIKEFYGVPFLNESSAFTLSTRVLGGEGSITVSPQQASYKAGEQVVVSATPNEGYVLDEWLGDATGADKTDTLVFYADRSVMARFRFGEYYYLNITAENGTVSQSIPGNEHLEKTDIELTATPADRYEFVGWTGDVVSTANPLTISLDSTMNVVANYRELDLCKLTVNVVGNGQVSLLPEQDEYLRGTEVTVFAQANDDDVFQNWSGDYQGIFSIIYVDMDSAITITANFSGVSSVEAPLVSQSSVFPNPSNGEMTLTTATNDVYQYSISNLEGKVIQTGTVSGNKQIQITSPGYYFIHLTFDNHTKTIRVLVQD